MTNSPTDPKHKRLCGQELLGVLASHPEALGQAGPSGAKAPRRPDPGDGMFPLVSRHQPQRAGERTGRSHRTQRKINDLAWR